MSCVDVLRVGLLDDFAAFVGEAAPRACDARRFAMHIEREARQSLYGYPMATAHRVIEADLVHLLAATAANGGQGDAKVADGGIARCHEPGR